MRGPRLAAITAITRQPSPLAGCELTFLSLEPIDFDEACRQHRAYRQALERCGAEVHVLDALPSHPDAVFVEDVAVVLGEVAVLTPMGAPSRRGEGEAVAAALSPFREVRTLSPSATLEGGDVLRVGKRLFVGLSSRTNAAGIEAFERLACPLGYRVIPVEVSGCLHLKTGCTALDEETVLINPEWVDSSAFAGFERVEVAAEEPFGANVLRVGETILAPSAFPRTRKLLEARGLSIEAVDISEFAKAEAGLTCLSLVFEAQ